MVHYIRFLKTPRIANRTAQSVSVIALITITTDLGDTFLSLDADLVSALVAADDTRDSFCKDQVQWRKGSRELSLRSTISNFCQLPSSLRLHVSHATASSSLPSILDAWSAPFMPLADSPAAALVERRLPLARLPYLRIWEETDNSIARHIWDAALGCLFCFRDVLSARTPMLCLAKVLRGRASGRVNVLELGAGCGIVGIALAHSFPNCAVQLSDRTESQEVLCRNVNVATPAKNSSLQVRTLDWNQKADGAGLEHDLALVIVSDCTYNADSCPDLVDTLGRVSAASPGVRILVALKKRHDSEDIFFSLMLEAHMQVLEQTTIELPHEPSVHDSNPTKVELYVYSLQQDR